jgi:hypothetical protein
MAFAAINGASRTGQSPATTRGTSPSRHAASSTAAVSVTIDVKASSASSADGPRVGVIASVAIHVDATGPGIRSSTPAQWMACGIPATPVGRPAALNGT